MPGWIGPWEIAILLLVVLLVFGPKRLPEMGRSLGRGMREFKNSITGKDDDHNHREHKVMLEAPDVDDEREQLRREREELRREREALARERDAAGEERGTTVL